MWGRRRKLDEKHKWKAQYALLFFVSDVSLLICLYFGRKADYEKGVFWHFRRVVSQHYPEASVCHTGGRSVFSLAVAENTVQLEGVNRKKRNPTLLFLLYFSIAKWMLNITCLSIGWCLLEQNEATERDTSGEQEVHCTGGTPVGTCCLKWGVG